MKKFYLLLITLFFSTTFLKAQLLSGTYNDYFREGSFLLLEENFDQALKNFIEAYKIDSSSANINFNVGYCYLKSSTKKGLAEKHLAKAITDVTKNYRQDDPTEKSAPPLAHFYYGRALHINYKFDEAAAQYDIFEKNYAKDKLMKDDVVNYKQQTAYAKELVAGPIPVTIENLGDSINSEYPDFSPVLSADERMIIYTTRRNTSTGGEKAVDGQYFEDIVVSYKDENGIWSSPKPISAYINTNGNEGSINLTPDGQTLIVYQDIGKGGDIYFSTWDGKDWSALQQFGSDVNTKHWETHACLTADQNTLYFVSDRPGGFGGRDIYRCVKLPNGAWSKALNLGPTINTKFDEDGPYMHPDGITMIFASSGHKTMGGFDIFVSMMDEEKKFSAPTNMGYPINTPDDDIFFVTSPDGKRGYFSSAKDGGKGEKDIYQMSITTAKESPLALFKGSILPADGEKLPEDLEVVVTNKETGEVIGRYKPKQNGAFTTILPPNKNYNFSYQSKGEEFYNEDIFVSDDVAYQEIKKEINLEPVNLLGKVKVKDKGVILNTIVLNNPKEKKPVPNAKITLTEIGGADTNFDVDANGKKDGTVLVREKQYSVLAESNGKQSVASKFNTLNVKGSKSITQVLYINGYEEKALGLLLNVLVVNNAKKPLPNTKVILTGNDGSKYEGTTDSKGRIKNIELASDVNYDLMGENNGLTSEKSLFTTLNVNTKKVYEKVIVLDATPMLATAGCGSQVKYKHFFSYNKNDIENEAEDWNNLISSLVAKTKECSPTVKVLSSASQVPTRAFANNKELAETRANKMEEKIKAAVNAKGGDASKIVFVKVSAVRGPAYAADYQNTEKYGPFQYVRVIAK
jgi:hypothetical protein